MKGTSEERTERGMDGARERGEGGSEWRRGIEREREGAWEQGREGNFKGGSIILFTNQPFTNRPLPLRLGAYAMAWTRCITGNPSEAG